MTAVNTVILGVFIVTAVNVHGHSRGGGCGEQIQLFLLVNMLQYLKYIALIHNASKNIRFYIML